MKRTMGDIPGKCMVKLLSYFFRVQQFAKIIQILKKIVLPKSMVNRAKRKQASSTQYESTFFRVERLFIEYNNIQNVT